jgi:serine/threonine protein kinase
MVSQGNGSKAKRVRRFKINDIELATCHFHKSFSLSNAAFTQAFRARIYDGSLVMIKKSWSGDRYWDGQLGLQNEQKILSSCKGKYLLNLIGVSDDTPERILVFEYAHNGLLYDALHNKGHGAMNWPARIRIAHQVAISIRGLHSANVPIIHRDVKSANIWIDSNGNVKLGGFEFAIRASDMGSNSNRPIKAMSSMDPDYQSMEHLCAKTDVFCFGVLLLEIISGRKALDMGHNPPFVVDWALPIIRKDKAILLCDPKIKPPPQNLKVILDMARIAVRCVNSLCWRRPTMADVAEELKMVSLKFLSSSTKKRSDWGVNNMETLRHHTNALPKTANNSERAGVHAQPHPEHFHRLNAEESSLRSHRPSMLFGLLAPKPIGNRDMLQVLDDAISKKQREPLLPPHLRHENI